MERFLGFAAADLVHQNPDKIQVITELKLMLSHLGMHPED
jgi:hypothetical protein